MSEFQESMALVESLAEQLEAAVEAATEAEGRGERDALARARAHEALMLLSERAKDAADVLSDVAVAA